jgi:hypothetical protein
VYVRAELILQCSLLHSSKTDGAWYFTKAHSSVPENLLEEGDGKMTVDSVEVVDAAFPSQFPPVVAYRRTGEQLFDS